jgi:RNA polymerase sigma factor (sigma-70 family)
MSMEPPHTPDEDDHLIDALSEDDHVADPIESLVPRDDEAFANELESFRPNGIRVAAAILRNTHEAEDVVDEVIAKLFINGIGYGVSHKPWFIRCVQNAAKDRVGSASWRNTQDDTILADVRSKVEEPLEQALRNQRVEIIQKGLLHLSSDDREILRLRFFEYMKIEEMAYHLNVPTNTLYSRLQRAVKRLAKILKKGGKNNV